MSVPPGGRGGATSDPAFLLKGSDGTLWMMVGNDNDLNFVGLPQAAGLASADEPTDADSDDLDFEMM